MTYRRELPDSLSPLAARSFPQASASVNVYIPPTCKAQRKVNSRLVTDGGLINRSDFLAILQNAHPGDTVMVHAPAGFGKSSLFCYTTLEWHKGNTALRRYRYLYLLPVRRIINHREVLERIITKDLNLLEVADESKVRRSLKFSSDLCLILIDGFDEMNDAVREITVLNELITRKHHFIKEAVVVVSTTPNYIRHILHKAGGSLIDLPLTTLDKEDVKAYVNQMFANDNEKAAMIYKALLAIPAPDDILYVPLFTAMLCCLCNDELVKSGSLNTLSLLRTTSSILHKFWMFLVDIKHHKASSLVWDDSFLTILERETRGRVKDVARLCFDSLEIGLYVFSESLLKQYDLILDDLTKLGPVDVVTTGDRSLSFIHGSFQEYCAGMYIVENKAALMTVLNEWRGGPEPTELFSRYRNALIYAVGIDSNILSRVPYQFLRLRISMYPENIYVVNDDPTDETPFHLINMSIESLLLHECENEDTRLEFIERIKAAPVDVKPSFAALSDRPDINIAAYETLVSRLGYSGCLEIVSRVYPERDEDNPHLIVLPSDDDFNAGSNADYDVLPTARDDPDDDADCDADHDVDDETDDDNDYDFIDDSYDEADNDSDANAQRHEDNFPPLPPSDRQYELASPHLYNPDDEADVNGERDKDNPPVTVLPPRWWSRLLKCICRERDEVNPHLAVLSSGSDKYDDEADAERDEVNPHLTVLSSVMIYSTMWIRLDKRLCQIPIVFGLVYNPPDNSPYADISIFDQIENTIIDIKSQNSKTGICLLGDLNARTGTLSDQIETTDTMYEDGTVMLDNDDASCTTSQSRRVRSNSDKVINQMGRRLIDMCRSLNLHILNGRYGGDHDIGKPTCKNSSTVDYIIISENLSKIISDFDILEFDRTLYDIHCPIYASFDSTPQISAQYKVKHYEPHKTTEKNKFKWNSNFIDIYRENLTNLKNDIEDSIHRAEIKGSPLEEDINEIANVISEALKKAAYNSGMGKSTQKTNVKKRRRQLPHKPWYDDCCEKSRKSMINFRKQYRKDKNTENLNLVKKSSTKYKKIVHKAYSEYKKKLISKLRLLQSENPKEYWKIIKGRRNLKFSIKYP